MNEAKRGRVSAPSRALSLARLTLRRLACALALIAAAATLAAACGGAHAVPPSGTQSGGALPAGLAGSALRSFNDAFYVQANGIGYFKRSTIGATRAVFWTQAEMIEMIEDAYQTGGDQAERQQLLLLLKGYLYHYDAQWTVRTWNDDIMWAVIAYVRAYEITGDTGYRDIARQNFDLTYARAWSTDFGGGLWWRTDRTEKNVTTNAPAAIAACHLYMATHDPSYLAKAVGLFAWVRSHLFDVRTGQVFDNVRRAAGSAAHPIIVQRWKFTYNQGSFIGAADLLYRLTGKRRYLADAAAALGYTRSHLTARGILQSEGKGTAGEGGFKGIFVRYAIKFTRDNHITAYDAWFRQNAAAAWSHRNAAGLIAQDWSRQTGAAPLNSFECSSAVELLQLVSP
jgi:predicted alpha-1,6-mannanase (GH76 family)